MGAIHFIRHGDTEASGDGVFCGALDVPLAKSGIEQAERLAPKVVALGVKALYASPKLRARMTAEPVCRATKLTPVLEDGLKEILYGSWDGRHESEIKASEPAAYAAWTSDPGGVAPPGGESGFAIAARAMPVVARILEAHPHDDVAVFSHKATIRIITCVLLGVPVSRFRDRIGCPTASITSFSFGAHGPLLVRLGGDGMMRLVVGALTGLLIAIAACGRESADVPLVTPTGSVPTVVPDVNDAGPSVDASPAPSPPPS